MRNGATRRPPASRRSTRLHDSLPKNQAAIRDRDATLALLDTRFAAFLDHARYVLGHSRKSLKIAQTGYRNFLLYLGDVATDHPMDRAIHDLDAWVAWNRRAGRSPITTNTYWRSLRSFFRYIETTEGVVSPYHTARPPRFSPPLPKALTEEELRRVLLAAQHYPWPSAYIRERTVGFVAIMAYAGLRRSEATHLLFDDVRLDEGTLVIRKGKGRNGGKDRTGYIPTELRIILTRFLVERRRARIVGPEFFASLRNRPVSPRQMTRTLAQLRHASGVAVTWHRLRHSFVTHLLSRNVPIHVAQRLAGHTSIQTTAGYLGVFDDELHHHIQKLRFTGNARRGPRTPRRT